MTLPNVFLFKKKPKQGTSLIISTYKTKEDTNRNSRIKDAVEELTEMKATILFKTDVVDALRMSQQVDYVRWNNPHSSAFPRVGVKECAVKDLLKVSPSSLKQFHVVSSYNFREFDFPTLADGTDMVFVTVEKHVNPFPDYDPRHVRGSGYPEHPGITYRIYSFQPRNRVPVSDTKTTSTTTTTTTTTTQNGNQNEDDDDDDIHRVIFQPVKPSIVYDNEEQPNDSTVEVDDAEASNNVSAS